MKYTKKLKRLDSRVYGKKVFELADRNNWNNCSVRKKNVVVLKPIFVYYS